MSVVALPEKVHRHRHSHRDDEAADPWGRKLLGVVGAEVSAEKRAHDHDAALFASHSTGPDAGDDADAVDDPAEHDLQGVHDVKRAHAEFGGLRKVQNPNSA